MAIFRASPARETQKRTLGGVRELRIPSMHLLGMSRETHGTGCRGYLGDRGVAGIRESGPETIFFHQYDAI